MTIELVEWLRARLDEDEQAARAAAPGPWTYQDVDSVGGGRVCDPTVAIANVDWDVEQVDPRIRRFRPAGEADGTGEHIARHDPARVLAEVAAKRDVLTELRRYEGAIRQESANAKPGDPLPTNLYAARDALREAVRLLTLPYAGHPDYRAEWSPDEEVHRDGTR